MEVIGCARSLVTNYQITPRNIPEEPDQMYIKLCELYTDL